MASRRRCRAAVAANGTGLARLLPGPDSSRLQGKWGAKASGVKAAKGWVC